MTSIDQDARHDGTFVREPDEGWERKREELRDSGVAYCLSAYVDVHGVPKAKAVPIDHFTQMMGGSELFTGAAIDGLGQGPADDELAVWPDLDAITQLPWEPTVAWAPGQLHFHGQPYPMDSRTVLRRQTDRLAELGLQFNLGIEPSSSWFAARAAGSSRPTPRTCFRAPPTTSQACSRTCPSWIS